MSRRDITLKFFDKHADFMEEVVKPGIEQNRKGNVFFEVVDAQGNPIPGAEIHVNQTNHAFRHGANIFMLDEMETPEKNAAYKEDFKNIFNLATIPFYWDDLEPEKGKPRYAKDSPKIYRRPAPDLCLEYCLENGIEPKCHCLNYEKFMPKWLKEADTESYKKELDRHFRELAERYSAFIPSWEVTNETLSADYDIDKCNSFFADDDYVEWSFRLADKYFPTNRLIINEYFVWRKIRRNHFRGNRSLYYMQIERLLRNGITHLDTIGMQFHFFIRREEEEEWLEDFYNPVAIYEVLDKYAQLGKRIQITEMTVPAYSRSQEDEDIQAELIEKLYTVFFSHPAMEAIIYWNLVDGYAAWAPLGDMNSGENYYHGGLINFDMTKKKAYHVIKKLFSETWHTEKTATTDAEGKSNFRAFYGDYDLTVTVNGKKVEKKIMILPTKNNLNKIVID